MSLVFLPTAGSSLGQRPQCRLSTADCSTWLVKCGWTAGRSEVVQWLVSGSQDSADGANSSWLHALLGTKRNYSYTLFFFTPFLSPTGWLLFFFLSPFYFDSVHSDTAALFWIFVICLFFHSKLIQLIPLSRALSVYKVCTHLTVTFPISLSVQSCQPEHRF